MVIQTVIYIPNIYLGLISQKVVKAVKNIKMLFPEQPTTNCPDNNQLSPELPTIPFINQSKYPISASSIASSIAATPLEVGVAASSAVH